MLAAYCGKLAVVRFLLRENAKRDAKNKVRCSSSDRYVRRATARRNGGLLGHRDVQFAHVCS